MSWATLSRINVGSGRAGYPEKGGKKVLFGNKLNASQPE